MDKFFGSSAGMTIKSSDGSVAHITSNYNTGWMHGDTKLAALCDTEIGSITGGNTPDRSGNDNHFNIVGTLNRAPIGNGEIAAWSGFSASDYLESTDVSDFNFGTGDFDILGWAIFSDTSASSVMALADDVTIPTPVNGIGIYNSSIGFNTRIAGAAFNSPSAVSINTLTQYRLTRKDGEASLYINGLLVNSATATGSVTLTPGIAKLQIGRGAYPANNKQLMLPRISTTAPSAQQVFKDYCDELAMIQGKATLYGSSDAVTALAHDPVTDILHVGTSSGRSIFRNLTRVDNTTDPVGSAISAVNNLVVED